jgi:hypothetical protein
MIQAMAEKSEKPTNQEIAQRRDEALRRALNTPPKPHKQPTKKENPKAHRPNKSE